MFNTSTQSKPRLSCDEMLYYCDNNYLMIDTLRWQMSCQGNAGCVFSYQPNSDQNSCETTEPQLVSMQFKRLSKWTSHCAICMPAGLEGSLDFTVKLADDMHTSNVIYFMGQGPVRGLLPQPDPLLRPADERLQRNKFLCEWLSHILNNCIISQLR